MQRTVSEAVKCFSTCGVCGIRNHRCEGKLIVSCQVGVLYFC
jgi:hypothetical protein